MEWQPIETAPKRIGEVFLIWSKRDNLGMMENSAPNSTKTWSLHGRQKHPEPTHWMPLPKPPTE